MADNPIWEICERVAEVQALLDDQLAGGCGGEIPICASCFSG